MGAQEKDPSSSRSGGCMPSIFHLFRVDPYSVIQHRRRISSFFRPRSFRVSSSSGEEMGLQRRRSSVESVKPVEDENMDFPMGLGIRIKTAKEESSCSSPAVRTPNLVAKLMGLDMLSESGSPFAYYTPRTKSQLGDLLFIEPSRYSIDIIPSGSGRRSEADGRHFHRLSLDIYREKDNADVRERESCPLQGENRTAAKSKVKSRLRGRNVLSDITNLNMEEEEEEEGHGERSSGKLNSSKSQFVSSVDAACYGSQGIFRPLKPGKRQEGSIRKSRGTRNSSELKKKQRPPRPNNKNMTKESFFRSESKSKATVEGNCTKKTHPQNEMIHVGSLPKMVPATKLPQKQFQVAEHAQTKDNNQPRLSSKTSHPHTQLLRDSKQTPTAAPESVFPHSGAAESVAGTAAEYKHYIQRILKRGGFMASASFTSKNWHNPSHPLDPSVFNYLELFHPNAHASCALRRRCDRKLLFQLVDEILKEILEPQWESKNPTLVPHRGEETPDLMDQIWKKIQKLPAATCEFIEDIDALIHEDLKDEAPPNGCLEAEASRLVSEIEARLVGMLLHETVEEVAAGACNSHVLGSCPA